MLKKSVSSVRGIAVSVVITMIGLIAQTESMAQIVVIAITAMDNQHIGATGEQHRAVSVVLLNPMRTKPIDVKPKLTARDCTEKPVD